MFKTNDCKKTCDELRSKSLMIVMEPEKAPLGILARIVDLYVDLLWLIEHQKWKKLYNKLSCFFFCWQCTGNCVNSKSNLCTLFVIRFFRHGIFYQITFSDIWFCRKIGILHRQTEKYIGFVQQKKKTKESIKGIYIP